MRMWLMRSTQPLKVVQPGWRCMGVQASGRWEAEGAAQMSCPCAPARPAIYSAWVWKRPVSRRTSCSSISRRSGDVAAAAALGTAAATARTHDASMGPVAGRVYLE